MSGTRSPLLGDWFQPPDDPQANVTHNIVMFDADTINLLRKYDIAGLGIGLGAAATQGSE